MPAKREVNMRQLRHLLHFTTAGSARAKWAALGVARSTIQDNLKRAAAAGLAWPLADDVTDEVLELLSRYRYVASDGVKAVFEGGPRTRGHIMSYSELSHSSRVLSSFQARRAWDSIEIAELTSQARSASALARNVSSA